MKIPKALSALFLTIMTTTIAVGAEEKMTYEKAMASHKATYGKYSTQSITEAQSQKSWDDYKQRPELSTSGANDGALTEVWSGKATSIKNTWGEGAFLIQLADPYQPTDTVASLWLKVDGSKLQRSSAVSMYGYEKSWFVEYKNNTFYGVGVRESTPSIISIAKQEIAIKMYNDCTPGQSEGTQNYSCANPSIEKLCENGYRTRTCASNGVWNQWEVKAPLCVRRDRECP